MEEITFGGTKRVSVFRALSSELAFSYERCLP
nr:MAG TPA_asm: hypothetical protein [Caudoviricetes sp.]